MLLLAQLLIGGIFGPSGLSRGLVPWNRALSRGSLKGLLSKKSSTMRGLGSGVKGPSLRRGFGIKTALLAGSWAVTSGVISLLKWVIIIVTLLLTPLITIPMNLQVLSFNRPLHYLQRERPSLSRGVGFRAWGVGFRV